LIKAGAEVQVILTGSAGNFVTPLSLATVSHRKVISDISDGGEWNNHVSHGLWADVMVIAPCTANTLAKLANGLCDNMVTAVFLSARCPVFVAPAMDEDMWNHPSTRNNLDRLKAFGVKVLPVGHGELASGLNGPGRMAEPETITAFLDAHFDSIPGELTGKKALVTAGPTYERIDPVRFIGNFSTGKMGIEIARKLHQKGADVHLVLGPSQTDADLSGINVTRVENAEQMFNACSNLFTSCDIAVLAAAVADYRPAKYSDQKIKKKDNALILELVKTTDILATLGKTKKGAQILAGFALETQDGLQNAQEKLTKKNADMIVLNSLQDEGAGFAVDTNKVTILTRKEDSEIAVSSFPLMSKTAVADVIVEQLILLSNEK
jgi:phosphopantothenoylcysteine decarboxylase/phosphopantothenate--cysteine ligase